MIQRQPFGIFDGQSVTKFVLTNAQDVRAEIMDWGATLVALYLPVVSEAFRNIVLGFDNFDDYPARSPYFGATCGRFANRIANASFELDDVCYQLDRNQDDTHHLHGGGVNFSKRLWQAWPDGESNAVNFQLISADGDQGYPGAVMAACTYRLTNENCLSIVMTAVSTKPTPINMAHHSYWNLDSKEGGIPLIDGHWLKLEALHYLPTGNGQIPTGEVLPVRGTGFDFKQGASLASHGEPRIDHCFVVSGECSMRPVATLASSDGKIKMKVLGNQPGVQVYTGFKLGIDLGNGDVAGPRSGICFETQAFPNAPNEPSFPSAILRPGETYFHAMEHRFTF